VDEGLCHAWLGMFLVKSAQDRFELLTGMYGVSSQSEAVAKIPSLSVERRAMPRKPFDRTIAQYEEVSFAISWHPSVVLGWSLRFSSWHVVEFSALYNPS